MIKLQGFAVSNYFNMVKFALLEKGIAYEEVTVTPSQEAEFKLKSPMGKIPCLETDQGFISETNVILDYLEASHPSPALISSDAFNGAKMRELINVLILYIELPARRHYGEIFFGGERNAAAHEEARTEIEKGLAGLNHLAKIGPYICGEFSLVDIVAAHVFIYAAPVCKAVYDWDIVSEVNGLAESLEMTNNREIGVQIIADQQAAFKAFMESQG